MVRVLFAAAGEENLGIEYLSAALKRAGHLTFLSLDERPFSDPNSLSVGFLGRLFDFKKEFLAAAAAQRPGLVCFSVNTSNYRWALGLAGALKASRSAPLVVFGGPHATAVPEAVISEPCVDACCVGEGEGALVELADALDSGSGFSAIKNLWVKTSEGVVRNPVRAPLRDLDALPPPDKDLYYSGRAWAFPGYIVLASRGCPFSCSYCQNSVLSGTYAGAGGYYRRRSPENVVAELALALRKYAPRYVRFEDEVFTADIQWLRKFLPLYAEKIRLPFDCSVHPRCCGVDALDLLRQAGCAVARMGVQSLDEGRRGALLKRHYSNAEVARAIAGFKARGIFLACDNIFGVPGQDEEELRAAAGFYIRNKPDHISVHWLNYYPRTPITKEAVARGLIDRELAGCIDRGLADSDNVRGGIAYRREFAPYQALMALIPLLPERLAKFFLGRKIVRLLPAANPYFLMVFSRLLSRPPFDIYPARTARRYLASVLRRLFPKTPGFIAGPGARN